MGRDDRVDILSAGSYLPFLGLIEVVREEHAFDIDVLVCGVVELNPVALFIEVTDVDVVGGADFVDLDRVCIAVGHFRGTKWFVGGNEVKFPRAGELEGLAGRNEVACGLCGLREGSIPIDIRGVCSVVMYLHCYDVYATLEICSFQGHRTALGICIRVGVCEAVEGGFGGVVHQETTSFHSVDIDDKAVISHPVERESVGGLWG